MTLPASIIRISRFCISAVVTVIAKSVCFSGTFRVYADNTKGGDRPFLLTAESTTSYSLPGFNPFKSNIGVLRNVVDSANNKQEKKEKKKKFIYQK
jgi:hypothetical protein